MNKRGFTLIELLAVIVILAIISLIAVPQATNTVSNLKNRTQEISAENYVRALKKSIAAYNLEKKFEPEACEYEDGITTCDDFEINV